MEMWAGNKAVASRKVAVVEVEADAARAFRSMLEVLNGRTRCDWRLVNDVNEADVIVTSFVMHRGGTSSWVRDDACLAEKHLVAVVESPGLRPPTPYVLTHPFRVMQVLSILDEIADQPAPPRRAEARGALQAPCEPGSWEFAASLRVLSKGTARTGWYLARTGNGDQVLIAGDLQAYLCTDALADEIKKAPVALRALKAVSALRSPPRLPRRPLAELLWHHAYQAAPTLAPWLDASAAFGLRRWPDFGFVPATRTRLQLIAALSMRARTRSELAHCTQASRSEIDRTLNALSLCDLLATDAPAAGEVALSAPAHPAGLIRSLVASLRKTLQGG